MRAMCCVFCLLQMIFKVSSSELLEQCSSVLSARYSLQEMTDRGMRGINRKL